MALRDDLIAVTPRLRRYARALVAGAQNSAATADDLVHATLMRALVTLPASGCEDVLGAAYTLLTEVAREVAHDRLRLDATASGPALARGPNLRREAPADAIAAALGRLRLDEREALLLVAVEGLDHAKAAQVLKISSATLIARLSRARAALAGVGGMEPRRRDHLRLVQ